MAREDLHFRLRLPEELKARIEKAAEQSHRSMTAEIVSRLEQSLALPPLDLPAKTMQRMLEASESERAERGAALTETLLVWFPEHSPPKVTVEGILRFLESTPARQFELKTLREIVRKQTAGEEIVWDELNKSEPVDPPE